MVLYGSLGAENTNTLGASRLPPQHQSQQVKDLGIRCGEISARRALLELVEICMLKTLGHIRTVLNTHMHINTHIKSICEYDEQLYMTQLIIQH